MSGTRFPKKILEKARKVRFLLLDVDGVMTDGTIYLDNDGRETKAFNIYDGSGIHHVKKLGLEVGIITGRESRVVSHRAKELGITEVHQKVLNKIKVYEKILSDYSLRDEDIAYIGDDIIDLPVLTRVGFSVSVPNAHPEVKQRVDWITTKAGGHGAVREVTDLLVSARSPEGPGSLENPAG